VAPHLYFRGDVLLQGLDDSLPQHFSRVRAPPGCELQLSAGRRRQHAVAEHRHDCLAAGAILKAGVLRHELHATQRQQ
jgi:hypothetical protein